MINSTAPTAWLELAPCIGAEAFVFTPDTARRPVAELREASAPLLRACLACPVLEECYRRVRPKGSQFDGVCSARIWVNGREVGSIGSAPKLPKVLPSQAGVCGESSGVKGHRRNGEPLCGQCRVTAQRAESRAAGAATIRKRGARSARKVEPAAA
ncbi:hypothetical protein OTB20_34215 [Streptomyces sp. H27-H1]|uniref:hypothetical protein n=1 Tax=unclassified Streptomyces TaxID=2593676 RepID=UPI0022707774|nr:MULTISPECIES: hypothetical protein [unclassified Streptomyces]MCY0931151.1 hypothetical protein [Streptomyces sp. H27-H1]MCY0939254.1 hypothetical protein [Streptomyces sp. H34-S4]